MPFCGWILNAMNDDLQKRITEAMAHPQNMGELPNADAVGTVGNSECGEMLRMWIKYKQENGRKVIDRATSNPSAAKPPSPWPVSPRN